MMNGKRNLPIGIQDFEFIRRENYLYVDKTEYIYQLVHYGKPYFLSRPRRFGKSLLLSTLRCYWEGRRELFNGLAIEKLEEGNEEAFAPYPVFYFDFNKKNFKRETALEEVLGDHLAEWEAIYGDEYSDKPLEERFQHLLVKAVEKTGRNAVVLVDEYDKPLLEAGENTELEEDNKAVFKGFFSTLKSYDRYLQFVFFTGVTKFSKVSVFSDLNQLMDISIDKEYAGICGITEAELKEYFAPEVAEMAAEQELSGEECYGKLKSQYDGYHFHYISDGVYNPFSLLNALRKKEFGDYWFETGTPTFLLNKLKKSGFDAKQFTGGELYEDARKLTDYRTDDPDPLPLFFQTGYLTIKDYDKEFQSYQLGYPNEEVKYGFLKSLVPIYLHDEKSSGVLDIRSFVKDIRTGNTDGLKARFTALYAGLPYANNDANYERDFQNVIYIVFMLLGQYVQVEQHNALGRADAVVETEKYVYIFEFKRDKSAEEALKQIEEKKYADRYAADTRTIIKIGANFSTGSRSLDGWEETKHGGKRR